MAKEIFYFMTRNDWISILQKAQQSMELKFVRSTVYPSKEIEEYLSLEEYEGLGINKSGDHQSESFLVVERTQRVNIEEVQLIAGGVNYHVDQLYNQESVILWPGGFYDDKHLICGHLGTVYLNERSKKIFNLFQRLIKKQCVTKAARYYVSEEVKERYEEIRLITINVKQDPLYDLKL